MHKSVKISLLAVIVLVLIFMIPQVKYSFKAAFFIPQILQDIPIKPLEYISGKPTRTKITFTSEGALAEADLYIPSGNGIHPAVVFFMGIVPPDREEERIVALAEGLARTGMVVLIPWLETQNENRLIVEDIDTLVDAFIYLQSHKRVNRDKVGMGGICTGASMAVVAAQSEKINDEVAFINSFAGYYNAFDLIRSTASATRFDGKSFRDWHPDKLTKNMVVNHLIEGSDKNDRSILENIMIKGTWNPEEKSALSLSGRAVLTLISNPTFDEADKAVNDLNNRTTNFLETVSPSTKIDMLKAEVLLMHDFHDRLVPAEESRKFAESVRSYGGQIYHTEFSLFQNTLRVHMDENDQQGTLNFIRQAFKLYKHMYKIMSLTS